MRSMPFVIASMVATCSAGRPGVALEVTADVPIDRVELFVATSACYELEPAPCFRARFAVRAGQDHPVAQQRHDASPVACADNRMRS
jgi:hypothetical protein